VTTPASGSGDATATIAPPLPVETARRLVEAVELNVKLNL